MPNNLCLYRTHGLLAQVFAGWLNLYQLRDLDDLVKVRRQIVLLLVLLATGEYRLDGITINVIFLSLNFLGQFFIFER